MTRWYFHDECLRCYILGLKIMSN